MQFDFVTYYVNAVSYSKQYLVMGNRYRLKVVDVDVDMWPAIQCVLPVAANLSSVLRLTFHKTSPLY